MDPRLVSTLRNLRQALIRQTLRLHYSKVNVTLVCEDAVVSRTAFYRHFRNIDELLVYTFYVYLDELEPLLLAQPTLAGEARVLYAFISEHEDLFRAYSRIRRDYPGGLRIDKRLKAMIGEHFVHRYTDDVPIEIAVSHIMAAGDSLIRWFLDNKYHYTADDFAAIHASLLHGAVPATPPTASETS